MGMITVCKILFSYFLRSTNTLCDILTCHFKVYSPRVRSFRSVNREKILIESQCLGLKNRLVSIFEQKMVKESGKIASSLKLEIGFMDLDKRKLIPFPEEWLQSVKVPLKEELGLL